MAQEEEKSGQEKIEKLCSSTLRSTELGTGLLLPRLYRGRPPSRYVPTPLTSAGHTADEIV